MFENFKNFNNDETCNNYPIYELKDDYIIYKNSSCIFSEPLNISRNEILPINSEYPQDLGVFFIFRNGAETLFTKVATIIPLSNDVSKRDTTCPIIAQCKLSPIESSKIHEYLNLDFQIKIILINNEVLYTDIKHIAVKNTVENNR